MKRYFKGPEAVDDAFIFANNMEDGNHDTSVVFTTYNYPHENDNNAVVTYNVRMINGD